MVRPCQLNVDFRNLLKNEYLQVELVIVLEDKKGDDEVL